MGKGGGGFFSIRLWGRRRKKKTPVEGGRKLKKVFRVFRGAPDGGEEEAPERRSVKQKKETREERRKGKERSTCGAFKKSR